jgi:hypothetical protein
MRAFLRHDSIAQSQGSSTRPPREEHERGVIIILPVIRVERYEVARVELPCDRAVES